MNPQDQPPQLPGQTPVYQQVPANYAVAPVGAYVQPPDYGYQQQPQQPLVQQTVIHVGSCPTCGRGNLEGKSDQKIRNYERRQLTVSIF